MQGRFLLLKGTVFDMRVPFANIYFPNADHPQFLWRLLPELLEGILVFRGDLNFAMDPSLECSHKASLARSTFQALLKACETLCSLLFYKTKQNLAWVHRTMYKFSKLGSLLARAL